MQQRHRLVRAAFSRFEAVIGAVDTGLAEAQRFNEESLRLRDLAYRKNRAVKSMHSFARSDLRGGPSLTLILGVFHHLVGQARRMLEPNELLPEALLHTRILHFVAMEVFLPERQRFFRHRKACGLHLPGALPSRL